MQRLFKLFDSGIDEGSRENLETNGQVMVDPALFASYKSTKAGGIEYGIGDHGIGKSDRWNVYSANVMGVARLFPVSPLVQYSLVSANVLLSKK